MLWVSGGIIYGIFEATLECLDDLPLSILVRRPHKELCRREPTRSEERRWDVGQLGVRLQIRESDIQNAGRGFRAVGGWYGVKNEDTVK